MVLNEMMFNFYMIKFGKLDGIFDKLIELVLLDMIGKFLYELL